MKNFISILLVFTAFLLIIPAIALFKQPPESSTSDILPIETINLSDADTYKMLNTSTQSIVEISPRDYIIGAVFAQMPASFEAESLKTQAVLAHTYIIRQHAKEQTNPTPNLSGADFSDDINLYQAYFSKEQAKKLYGSEYDMNYVKISKAVDLVLNEIVTYKDEPIMPAFHSMSSGMTESAKIAWGNEIPYLQAVSSIGETKEKSFLEEKTISPDEMSARLTQGFSGLTLGDDKSSWISILEKSPSGTVISVKIGDLTVKGSELENILSLRSCFFEITFDGTNFKVATKGVGHGVGLSQYGANIMALEGKNYKEIVNYYYKNVDIKKLTIS